MKPDQNSHRMCLSIPQIIGLRQIFTLVLTASIVLSSQLCTSCIQEDKSTHYLKMVGSCNQPNTVKIYDETAGTNFLVILTSSGHEYSTKPNNTIDDKHFRHYVNTISQYIFAKVDNMGLCQGTIEPPQVDLVFVYRPAISRGITPWEWKPQRSEHTKYLDSPWVKLTLDKSPKTTLRGIFIWNERQFLLDQASIWERKALETKPLLPVDIKTFDQWERNYDGGYGYFHRSTHSLRDELPPDIRWLFIYASIDDCGYSAAACGLDRIAESEKLGYANLSKVLIDQLFAKPQTEIRYDSVLDLKDVFNINKYQIDSFTKRIK